MNNTLRARAVRAASLAVTLFALCAPPGASVAATGDLPDYVPHQHVTGVLHSSGDRYMQRVMRAWETGFRRYQPGLQFDDNLKGTASGMYGLEVRSADIAVMGRPLNPFERYGTYERAWVYPVEIEVATGSAQTPGESPALAIFVNSRNPLAKLTLAQLDGIFGAQRGGGWDKLTWDEGAARPASANIRTWGRVGAGGSLADKPIHVYGPPNLGAGAITFFQTRVLHGGEMWNEDLREYADRAKMMAALSADPYGIAYGPLAYRRPGVKAIAIAETAKGPYVGLDAASVAARSYPLARPVYIDYTIDDVRSEIASPRVSPKVEEFLRYVLSKQGQADVARAGGYLPLPASVVQRQLQVLSSHRLPPEKALLRE